MREKPDSLVPDVSVGPGEPELATSAAWVPQPRSLGAATEPGGRMHLVGVGTRPIRPDDKAAAGAARLSRFWHPRDRRWSENHFATLEEALHLFVGESGWVLLQQQQLEDALSYELIF